MGSWSAAAVIGIFFCVTCCVCQSDGETASGTPVADLGATASAFPREGQLNNGTTARDKIYPVNQAKRFEKTWKSAFKTGVKMIMPMIMNDTSTSGISGKCIRALTKYIGGLTSAKLWAAKMFDATSKPMSGIFEGTFSDFGAFDECLEITVPLRNGSEEFRGSYCAIEAVPNMPPRPKNFSMALQLHAGPLDTIAKELELAGGAFYYLKFRVGVCVPSSCSTEDIRGIATRIGKTMLMDIVIPTCYQKQDSIEFKAIHIVMICLMIVLLLLAIVGTRIEYLKELMGNNRRMTATTEKVLLAFSLRTNFKKLFAVSKGGTELKCLHGIRGLSIAWVLMGHTYVWTNFQLLRRPSNLQEFFSHLDFEAILNAWLSVEPFFVLSGLLTCYGCMQLMEKTKGKIHIPFFIIRRFIRLLPPMLVVMGLLFFCPLISSGPFWYERFDNEIQSCRSNWWTSILFISNWTPMKSICIHTTWFVSADFQLHILSLLILYPLYRSYKLGAVTMVLVAMAGNVAVAVLTYVLQLPPIIQISSGNDDQITETIEKIHIRTFTHVGPYIVGMATGYLLHKYKDIKMSRRVCVAGWCTSIVLSLASLYGVHQWNTGYPHGPFLTCVYAALHRTTFSMGVAWVAFACITGHGGPVNAILSSSFLAPISRLTFTIYLVQSLVIWTRRASDRERMYYSHYNHMYEYIGNVIISILVAIPLHILVEAPVSNLDRLLFSRGPRDKQQTETIGTNDTNGTNGTNGKVVTNHELSSNGISNSVNSIGTIVSNLDNSVELRSVKTVSD